MKRATNMLRYLKPCENINQRQKIFPQSILKQFTHQLFIHFFSTIWSMVFKDDYYTLVINRLHNIQCIYFNVVILRLPQCSTTKNIKAVTTDDIFIAGIYLAIIELGLKFLTETFSFPSHSL